MAILELFLNEIFMFLGCNLSAILHFFLLDKSLTDIVIVRIHTTNPHTLGAEIVSSISVLARRTHSVEDTFYREGVSFISVLL
jgi:hypothetical protein